MKTKHSLAKACILLLLALVLVGYTIFNLRSANGQVIGNSSSVRMQPTPIMLNCFEPRFLYSTLEGRLFESVVSDALNSLAVTLTDGAHSLQLYPVNGLYSFEKVNASQGLCHYDKSALEYGFYQYKEYQLRIAGKIAPSNCTIKGYNAGVAGWQDNAFTGELLYLCENATSSCDVRVRVNCNSDLCAKYDEVKICGTMVNISKN